jgi:hypothetical protein
MADPKQYLRLTFAGVSCLLPNSAGYTIENRENLILNDRRDGRVSAWRTSRNSRWPAYALDRNFKIVRRDDWQRAVFIEAVPHAIGVIVDDVHLLPRPQTPVAAFVPLGPPATRAGHLFSGAVLSEREVMLVLEPQAFVVYLQGLGD